MPAKVLERQPADMWCGACELWSMPLVSDHSSSQWGLSFYKFLLETLPQGLSSVYLVEISLQAGDPFGLNSLEYFRVSLNVTGLEQNLS